MGAVDQLAVELLVQGGVEQKGVRAFFVTAQGLGGQALIWRLLQLAQKLGNAVGVEQLIMVEAQKTGQAEQALLDFLVWQLADLAADQCLDVQDFVTARPMSQKAAGRTLQGTQQGTELVQPR
jgi:hypothetical protein